VDTFLDGTDPVIAARGDDPLPLSHGLPCRARVIAADIAALRARDEVLVGRREVGEARVVHGLSQAQGVIGDLYAIRHNQRCPGKAMCARELWQSIYDVSLSVCRPTYIFCSP
jgi:hypothetical protein